MRESWTAELVADVLDKTGCDALFNHLSGLATGTTKEIFFGHITGLKGFKEKSKGRNYQDKNNNIFIKYNDLDGRTRLCCWEQLRCLPSGRKVINSAKNLLRSLVEPSDLENTRLQCNVKFYSQNEAIFWHRDDATTENRQPLVQTFAPAAVTLFVWNPKLQSSGGGFAYAVPRSKFPPSETIFVGPEESQDLLNRIQDGEHEFVYSQKDHEQNSREIVIHTVASAGTSIGIGGWVYTHGVHTVVPTPSSAEVGFVRISLNFRFLRHSAFLTLNGNERQWDMCDYEAACTC